MFEDNKGCIALATNPMTTGKTKHIDVKYHSGVGSEKQASDRLV